MPQRGNSASMAAPMSGSETFANNVIHSWGGTHSGLGLGFGVLCTDLQ